MFSEFFLLAGPCALEDDGLNLEIARELESISRRFAIPVVFKGSFDKANRSKLSSPRGLGQEKGIEALAKVREATGLSIVTDIHEPGQAAPVGAVVDIVQIPAFLCRQTDLLVAAGRTGRAVNIKKGQWMAPEEMAAAVEKVRESGASEVAVTERGTFFGYGNLVVDMRSFERIRRSCGAPAVFDGTHSVQRPGRADGSSGGDPEFIPALVRAAVGAGCDGLFIEVHPDPASAPSDGTNMLPLERLPALLGEVIAIRSSLQNDGTPQDDRTESSRE